MHKILKEMDNPGNIARPASSAIAGLLAVDALTSIAGLLLPRGSSLGSPIFRFLPLP